MDLKSLYDNVKLLGAVETYLNTHTISASGLGRKVARDPRLVFDMRRGRQIGPKIRNALIDEISGDPQAEPAKSFSLVARELEAETFIP